MSDPRELLLDAIRDGDIPMVENLLAGGVDVSAWRGDMPGNCPVMAAVSAQNDYALRLLILHGADINLQHGEPLLEACRLAWEEGAAILLAAGADPESRGIQHSSPLAVLADAIAGGPEDIPPGSQWSAALNGIDLAPGKGTKEISRAGLVARFNVARGIIAHKIIQAGGSPDRLLQDGASPRSIAVEAQDEYLLALFNHQQ